MEEFIGPLPEKAGPAYRGEWEGYCEECGNTAKFAPLNWAQDPPFGLHKKAPIGGGAEWEFEGIGLCPECLPLYGPPHWEGPGPCPACEEGKACAK